MKRLFMRWFLLNKRLFKKPVFVLILCAVPLMITALNVVTANTDGFVKIVLAAEAEDDELARGFMKELSGSSKLVDFSMADSPEKAEELVRYGEADAAWIFKSDMKEGLRRLVTPGAVGSCIRVIERKETVPLRLSREKLAAVISSESCFELMKGAYSRNVTTEFDEAELRGYYDRAIGANDLFEFRFASGESAVDSDTSYLMLPIRGMLAVAILLAGFAMAMFRIHDRERMVFERISRAAMPAFELLYHLTGIVDVAAVVLISLYVSGNAGAFPRELISIVIYCLNTAVFVILAELLLKKAGRIAALTPMLTVLMIVVNPILFNLPFVHALRVMNPVFYYLQSAHNPAYLLYGLIYFAAVSALCCIVHLVTLKASFSRKRT